MPFHTNLAQILRDAGLRVVEVAGWQSRGHGPMGPVQGVMWHHDATPAGAHVGKLNTVIRDGRSDLPGPLANLYLNRDGTWYVVAAGMAYHAGNGTWPGLENSRGNTSAIGIEVANNGVGEPWNNLDSLRRGTAALLREFGLPSGRLVGHKEYCRPVGRKIDPAGLDMNVERRLVGGLMTNPPAGGEDLIVMALNDKFKDWAGNEQTGYSWAMNVDRRIAELHAAVLAFQPSRIPGDKNKTRGADLWFDAGSWTHQTLGRVANLEKSVADLDAKLDAIIGALGDKK